MRDSVKNKMMSNTQLRPSGDMPWYCPARDITCLVPELVGSALEKWDESGNSYKQWAARHKFTDEHIGEVAVAVAAFLSQECVIDVTSLDEALEKSGLLSLPPKARMVVFGMIGEELLGAFWYAIRSATTSKTDEYTISQYDPQELIERAHTFAKRMRMSRIKRKVRDMWSKLIDWMKGKM